MKEYRSFQVCINIFVYHYYGETKIFNVRNRFICFTLASFYSLVSLLFGIWRIPIVSTMGNIRYVFEAIKINVQGGNDYSTLKIEQEFDERTNFVWRNLPRDVKSNVTRGQVSALCEFQELYESLSEVRYEEQNSQFLSSKINSGIDNQLTKSTIYGVLKAIKIYDDSLTDFV